MSLGAIAILGSTGSIGTQTLAVVRAAAPQFQVVALSAGKNIELLADQIAEFEPELVSVERLECVEPLRATLRARGIVRLPEILHGEEGMCSIATHPSVHTLVAAVLGFAALKPVLAAISAGKQLALANKECLVAGGALIRAALQSSVSTVVPVDSEHSSIFQCLSR